MFKIVQTVEEEEICLTAVPSSWEKDGILFWPKKNIISRLVRDANSTPGIEWTKMACVVKRTAATYAEAESELAYMESQPDTDQEAPTVIEPPAPKKQRIELPDFDLNQMLESAAFEQNGIEDIHEVALTGCLETLPVESTSRDDLVPEEGGELRYECERLLAPQHVGKIDPCSPEVDTAQLGIECAVWSRLQLRGGGRKKKTR
ncbi:hypothetical protein quinque_008415 [Culex quinquefasciatus]